MQEAIHPTYYPEAKVSCSGCGREFTVGSTAKEIRVELCSQCHPFYTGKQKLVDTAGRVERFQARAAKAAKTKAAKTAKAKSKGKDSKPAETSKAKAEGEAETETKPSESTPTPAERLAAMKQDLEQRDQ
ncbi:MAG: 50S ribosomal protein L31 [bacterium]|nr:50S ribosomal protein L31 [bacterium]MDZ4248123.1 50S ribosomal protein L31 [Patescibacteria group bacterium]